VSGYKVSWRVASSARRLDDDSDFQTFYDDDTYNTISYIITFSWTKFGNYKIRANETYEFKL